MTFDEIKDMINSTIVENGQRQITGKSINLALIETLTAIEEYLANKSEGATSETFFLPDSAGELTPERQAHNAEVYNKFKSAFEEGKPLPSLSVDLVYQFDIMEEQLGQPVNAAGYIPCIAVIFVPTDSPLVEQLGAGLLYQATFDGTGMHGLILSDGNVTVMA